MEMNEESILAWNIIEKTNANLFLTGKAGTGIRRPSSSD